MKKIRIFMASPTELRPIDALLDEYREDSHGSTLTDAEVMALVNEVTFLGEKRNSNPTGKERFVWRSHRGHNYFPDEMATPHVFYALRMLWNHSVPAALRVTDAGGHFKRYRDIPHWNYEYRNLAMRELTDELSTRTDLERDLKDQFDDIASNAHVLLALGLLGPDALCDAAPAPTPIVAAKAKFVKRKKGTPAQLRKLVKAADAAREKNSKLHRVHGAVDQKSVRRFVGTLQPRNKVKGYTRANGNKVRGYTR
jgi:hypothetical protein